MEQLEDRLSELPVPLILLILSFLPMRDVVFTTFLSKYWRNLWTSVPCLNFCNLGTEAERVRNFVNSALKLWNGSKISRFSLDLRAQFDVSLARDIDSWVRFAVERSVEELNVCLIYDRDNVVWIEDAINCSKRDAYTVPRCLYSCPSLRKLVLVGCNLGTDVTPSWCNLESLVLYGFCFDERVIGRIVSRSRRLELFDLLVLESFENLSIRSMSLKRLKIGKYLYGCFDDASLDNVLSICCPNLETLELTRIPYSKCLFTDVSSVTDCALGFYNVTCDLIHLDMPEKELLGETIRQIFPAIQRVEKLTLSISSVEVLCALLKKKLLVPMPNVKFLKLTLRYDGIFDIEFADVMNLLGYFPNLKTLVIDDKTPVIYNSPPHFNTANYSGFKTNHSISFLKQLQKIRITSALSNFSIFWTIVFLLTQTTVLEKFAILIVPVGTFPLEFSSELAEKLSSMPISSPSARVIVENMTSLHMRSVLYWDRFRR